MIYVVCLVICFFVQVDAQSSDIHLSYTEQAQHFKLDVPDWEIPPCPWQSVRLIGYAAIQLDFIGSEYNLKAIDLGSVSRDLWSIYKGNGRSSYETLKQGFGWFSEGDKSIEVVDRDVKVRFHTSWPYVLEETVLWEYDYRNAYDPGNCPSPCGGWYMYALPNGMLYAQKDLGDGKYAVSFVQFLKIM